MIVNTTTPADTSTPAVPPLDLTPTGKTLPLLAGLPDQPAPQAPQRPATVGQRIADRILAEVPSLAAKTDPAGLADSMDSAIVEASNPVLLEEADLDPGVYVMFNAEKNPVRAAYDPKQNSHAGAEALLRVELGRRNRPVGVVVSVGGSLVLGKTPDGEPLHVEELSDGKTRMTLDTAMVPLDRALALLQQVRAEKGETAEASA